MQLSLLPRDREIHQTIAGLVLSERLLELIWVGGVQHDVIACDLLKRAVVRTSLVTLNGGKRCETITAGGQCLKLGVEGAPGARADELSGIPAGQKDSTEQRLDRRE